jgi:type II secretory pathway component PulF
LGSLLKNGVSILVALNITKEVVSNSITRSEVDAVIEEITQGAGVAAPLKRSQIFPPVAVNMMAVGEETGQLDNVLLRISQSFEVEVDRRLKTITSLIEPAIIIVMAVIVGFIVIAMLLPIFSLDPSGGGG